MGKHLNLSQRIIIESNLNENISLRKIGIMLGKPPEFDTYLIT